MIVDCRNKTCSHTFSLKKRGRYCAKCGHDYWDGLAGVKKILSKEELTMNNMKFDKMNSIKTALLSVLILLSGVSWGQTYPDEIELSDSTYSFMISDSQMVYGHQEIEFRNDSLCIEDGPCLFLVPGVTSYSRGYNSSTKGFDYTITDDGSTTVGFDPFYPNRHDVTQPTQNVISINVATNEPWESEAYDLKYWYLDNHLSTSSINDTTIRIYISNLGGAFGSNEIIHDSIDIVFDYISGQFDSTHIYQALADSMALDLDRDITNELDTILIQMSQPVSPKQGDIWINSITDEVKKYSGSAYHTIGSMSLMSSDDQVLSIDSTGRIFTLTLEDGGSVNFTDTVDDADSDPTNELFDSTHIYQALADSIVEYTMDKSASGQYFQLKKDGAIVSTVNGYWSEETHGYKVDDGIGIGADPVDGLSLKTNENMQIGNIDLGSKSNSLIFGQNAMLSNSLNNSVAIGTGALQNAPSGADFNVAIGTEALQNIDDDSNIGIGYRAGKAAGRRNVSLGYLCNESGNGDENVAIGYLAGRNNTGSKNIFLGTDQDATGAISNKLHIDVDATSTPLIEGNFSTNDITINGELYVTEDLDVTETLTIGDLDDGGGTSILLSTSGGKVVEGTIGSGLTITSGELDVAGSSQSFASATMNTATIDDTYTGSTYYNISMGTVRYSVGNVTANTSLERFEIDETAYYRIHVTGAVDTDSTDDEIEIYAKVGSSTYHLLGTLHPQDGSERDFHINQSLLLTDGDNVIIAAKHPVSGQGDISIITPVVDFEKI